jgi:sRNA-binding regulator protein Hfq
MQTFFAIFAIALRTLSKTFLVFKLAITASGYTTAVGATDTRREKMEDEA